MNWNTYVFSGKQTLGNEEFETFPVHSSFCFEFLKHRDHLICAEVLWPESNQSSGLVSMFSQTQTSDCCVNHFAPPEMYPFLENRIENLPLTHPY